MKKHRLRTGVDHGMSDAPGRLGGRHGRGERHGLREYVQHDAQRQHVPEVQVEPHATDELPEFRSTAVRLARVDQRLVVQALQRRTDVGDVRRLDDLCTVRYGTVR